MFGDGRGAVAHVCGELQIDGRVRNAGLILFIIQALEVFLYGGITHSVLHRGA